MSYLFFTADLFLRFFAIKKILLSKSAEDLHAGWFLLVLLIPFLGPVLFYLFHRRSSVSYERSRFYNILQDSKVANAEVEKSEQLNISQYHKLVKISNNIDSFNGNQFIDALLHRINSAKNDIFICTFIYKTWGADCPYRITTALKNAIDRGVNVTLLIDTIGSSVPTHYMAYKRLKKELKGRVFLFGTSISDINFRLHSKIAMFDSKYAIIGSHNIIELLPTHIASSKQAIENHDYSIGVSGEVLHSFSDYCTLLYYYVTGQKKYFKINDEPSSAKHGEHCARLIYNGLNYPIGFMEDYLSSTINAATQSIKICNPYVIAPHSIIELLALAVKRGVSVQICSPLQEYSNSFIPRNITSIYLKEYISKGCDVYAPKQFIHSKFMIIDNKEVYIGSQNFDFRSMLTNHEAILAIDNSALVAKMNKLFDSIKQHSLFFKGYSDAFQIPKLQLMKSNLLAIITKIVA